ncbi:hypothetical protein BaRGS_00023250 [Batillaria attramentaria]|uniref:Uncharacterized protein n=2 Tax=Batillaria attramentaria TaxID=370345 RepID=A0ABD0KEU5_9CAEN
MQKRRMLKDNDRYKSTFINDDLTPMRSKLLSACKDVEGVAYARSTHDGRILCTFKNPPGHTGPPKTQLVETPDDLFHLGVSHVNYSDFGLDPYGVKPNHSQ